MPKNLRLIIAPVAKVFASEDDFTPEVLAKLSYNIKHLQNDYLVFDSGGAVLLTANGRSDSLVHHQSQRGIVIGDISHQYKILFSGGLEPFWYPQMTFSGYINHLGT